MRRMGVSALLDFAVWAIRSQDGFFFTNVKTDQKYVDWIARSILFKWIFPQEVIICSKFDFALRLNECPDPASSGR